MLVIRRDPAIAKRFYFFMARQLRDPGNKHSRLLFISQGGIGDVIGFVRNDPFGTTVTPQEPKACD